MKKQPSIKQMSAELREKGRKAFLEPSVEKGVMYHGTNKDIKSFKAPKNAVGIWATKNPDVANEYATISAKGVGEPPSVYPVHVRLKNPANKDQFSDAWDLAAKDSSRFGWNTHDERHKKILQDQGFDGAILDDSVVVFDPKHVKSAIGNRGTYNVNNPDITKNRGGKVKSTAQMRYELLAKGGKVDIRPTVQDPNLQRRIPEIESAAKAFQSGEMNKKDYDKIVNKHKPVKPYDFIPKPASDEDAKRALMANKQDKWRGHESWPEGHKVGLRLDIPAYEHHGVWVNSIHDETNEKRPTSYGPVSSVKNAEFDPNPHKGIRVATGEQNKAPFARIVGDLHHMHEDEAVKHAQEHLNHPEWTQVGYDPRRHGYFYDRKTMKPVSHAEHVVQIGPLVLAKNVKHKKADSYADGGPIKGKPMNEPTLAQMRLEVARHSNPAVMNNIGVNEAVDIDPKMFVNPNPNSSGLPDVGGVKTDKGALPVGGVDVNPMMSGTQFMPQQPQQQPPQGQQSPFPSMAPSGSGMPQSPSNILNLTPQGQAMSAIKPPMTPNMAKGGAVGHFAKGGSQKEKAEESKRILVEATGPNGIKGIVIPRHMLEGKTYGGTGPKAGQKVEGLLDLNKARAKVYGSENRPPLNIGQMGRIHKQVLSDHFAKPIDEQTSAEKEALERLREAKHIGSKANTLDESEKLDTVRHETDDQGRTHVGYAAKGIAGHALYSSGDGKNEKLHVLNTCPGQVDGCGGGIDQNGIVDTKRGSCFAPNAESQYVNAAVRRAAHAQAKHDPAMTRDWVLAHTGSLREAADEADQNNQRLLFRPNVVDESDTSSRHVLRGLNEQRKKEDKPPIIANSYGKTNELHDPENHYHVTHSNVGPKTKHGKEITESIKRDKARVRNTILARDNQGDFVNEQGNKTPPKNSYMVTNVKRGSPFDKNMQNTITHAKYWSIPRPLNELTEMEKDEGSEGHYDGKGKTTTPDKSHYGHMVIGDNRYDYQKQHILHPRLVQVGTNNDGTPHMIPTDSRFLDNKELDKKIPRSKQFKTKNGKRAGLILMTTPTESTPNHEHHSSFTHDVNPTHLEYAKKNNGEYEIDPPLAQEFARGKEYVAPEPMKMVKKTWATGGAVHSSLKQLDYNDDFNAFPETNFASQHHLAKRRATKE